MFAGGIYSYVFWWDPRPLAELCPRPFAGSMHNSNSNSNSPQPLASSPQSPAPSPQPPVPSPQPQPQPQPQRQRKSQPQPPFWVGLRRKKGDTKEKGKKKK